MSSALKPGKPIRYRPSRPTSRKPPECAGIYYIYDADGTKVYIGQSVNLRRRVYEHKRKGKIPKGGYVDCFRAKNGITYDELDDTERKKIKKYNPPLNKNSGGGGKKSLKLDKHSMPEALGGGAVLSEPKPKRNPIYKILGYERIDRTGEVHYTKEPKAVFFMLIELVVKILLIVTTLLSALEVYLTFSKGIVANQYLLMGMAVIPIICFVLFHYIRRNKLFSIMSFFSVVASIALYLNSYQLPSEWMFWLK